MTMTQKDRPKKRRVRHPESAMAGTAALARFNETRHLLPKCGAKARSTGEPCKRVAMANGRCHSHGGRTPKGKEWHRRQWKATDTPNSQKRFERKLQELQRTAALREARLARMSPEERVRYDKWHRERPIGTPAHRKAVRDRRRQSQEFRADMEARAKASAASGRKVDAIRQQIAELRAELAALDEFTATAPGARQPDNLKDWDIFG